MNAGENNDVAVGQDARSPERGDRPPVVPNRGLMVRRTRLLRELGIQGAKAGITVVCAPDGMGKTALLLQYVAEVQGDVARGSARLLDVAGMDAQEVYETLKRLPDELPCEMHPLVAVDNMPELGRSAVEVFPGLLRSLRDRGIELMVSCKPTSRELLVALGDSFKIGAEALIVRPREYADWTKVFSIDRTLDVYGLTQGVPSLVAALQSVDGTRSHASQLCEATARLYEGVLEELRRSHDGLYRLACLLLLVGSGELSLFSRVGLRIRSDTLSRLARDYPVFGIDAERTAFACMMPGAKELDEIRKGIAQTRPVFAQKAVQALMTAGHVDDAVKVADMLPDADMVREVVSMWPLAFALRGNVSFVNRTMARLDGDRAANVPVEAVLAVYAGGLVSGEYRLARMMAAELHRRAQELQQNVAPEALATAFALADVWRDCSGTALPEVPISTVTGDAFRDGALLVRHREIWDALIGGDGVVPSSSASALVDIRLRDEVGSVDIPSAFLICDDVLNLSFHGDVGDALACDGRLQGLARKLRERKAEPVSDVVRMTAAVCRLMAGLSVVDERAFVDAGNAAVRATDFSMQLLCLLGEGWQALDNGQVVNARFRAQQVLRLAHDDQLFLRAWALLLERSAFIVNTAKYALSEEAELVDLSQERVEPAQAWSVALLLSAAGHASELSAWYSMHKATLLDAKFRPMALQAMRAVGDRADAVRGMLPERYLDASETVPRHVASLAVLGEDVGGFAARTGQVEVKLFGGFRIERNGHLLTDTLWRRKRLCVLTARLVLSLGSFVDRRVLTEEMWPSSDYGRARENLYTALSGLRSALGQQPKGPQYILTQGEGVAINGEYVTSDVARFDVLARDVLLKRTGTSGRQIVESCLKLEELYTGPLYVAELGDPTFHMRMRKLYLTKFVDCMLRGVEAALALEDVPSASWLIEAAQRHAPYREDVMRQAMRIYDRCGRRQEIVEMYGAHAHYLKQVLHTTPEDETQLAYESIMGKSPVAMLA